MPASVSVWAIRRMPVSGLIDIHRSERLLRGAGVERPLEADLPFKF